MLALAAGCGASGSDEADDGDTGSATESTTSLPADVERCGQVDFGNVTATTDDGVARLTVEPVEITLADGVYELVVAFTATADGDVDAPTPVPWTIEGLDSTGSPVFAVSTAADSSAADPHRVRTGLVQVEDTRAIRANARLAVEGDRVGAVFAPTAIEVFSTTGC
ncbi:MAG: hypothetical protein AAF467_24960 [Actinomycetota bacterium]